MVPSRIALEGFGTSFVSAFSTSVSLALFDAPSHDILRLPSIVENKVGRPKKFGWSEST